MCVCTWVSLRGTKLGVTHRTAAGGGGQEVPGGGLAGAVRACMWVNSCGVWVRTTQVLVEAGTRFVLPGEGRWRVASLVLVCARAARNHMPPQC